MTIEQQYRNLRKVNTDLWGWQHKPWAMLLHWALFCDC